jgi:hypothetical protein
MSEQTPTPEAPPSNPFAPAVEGADGNPTPPNNPFAPQPETPIETPPAVELSDEQRAVLAEHGITPSEDGTINVADHVKLLSSLSSLRQQVRKTPKAPTPAADPEGEQTPPVDPEAIRAETRAEVEAEMRVELTKSQVVAAAAAAGFADPKDAVNLVGDLADLTDVSAVEAAVKKLAEEKNYLLRKTVPSMEQGPQSSGTPATGGDWIRQVVKSA